MTKCKDAEQYCSVCKNQGTDICRVCTYRVAPSGNISMEEKQLFKVKITDENGNVVHEYESDCIIASISVPLLFPLQDAAAKGICIMNCDGKTFFNTFRTLDEIRHKTISKYPALRKLLRRHSFKYRSKLLKHVEEQ